MNLLIHPPTLKPNREMVRFTRTTDDVLNWCLRKMKGRDSARFEAGVDGFMHEHETIDRACKNFVKSAKKELAELGMRGGLVGGWVDEEMDEETPEEGEEEEEDEVIVVEREKGYRKKATGRRGGGGGGGGRKKGGGDCCLG